MNIKEIFTNTLAGLGVPDKNINEEWNFLFDCYTDGRYYHDINHIKKVLEKIELVKDNIEELELVKLAVFYHDIVYVVNSPYNEKQSAMTFGLRLGNWLDHYQIITVENLILATDFKREYERSGDEAYISDADIAAGITSDYDEFNLNNEKVIKEYAKVYGSDLALTGRKDFLSKLLLKEKIFQTEFFTTFEPKIKENIQTYLN